MNCDIPWWEKLVKTKQDIYVKYDIFSEIIKIVVLHHGL